MPRLSNIAVRTLQRQIREGYFASGAMLPGQRALAASLGISRTALREAVSTLEALGLLHSQPGKGVFVTAGQHRDPAELPEGPFNAEPHEVFQFRAVVEPGAAALAAQLATASDIARLEAIQRDMELALEADDLVAASESDLAFHISIADISGNPMLAAVIRSLESPIAWSLRLPFAETDSAWVPATEHRAVLDAVSARDSAAAHAAMRRHIVSAAWRIGIDLQLPNLVPVFSSPLSPPPSISPSPHLSVTPPSSDSPADVFITGAPS
jgi:GntR family transcriptional repressor for pyruvate dehydrogenase complex